MSRKPAVVLLSGGLDSSTVAAFTLNLGFEVNALSFSYGQRHSAELVAASRVVDHLGVRNHKVITIDPKSFGKSALTCDVDVPKYADLNEVPVEIPKTYVPARNTIFLSFALAWAETLECSDIFIGVTSVDYSGYPDCRPEYIDAFQAMARLATKSEIEGTTNMTIHAPLLELSKSEIIHLGTKLGVDYRLTVSCYAADSDGVACGHCHSCLLRRRGFQDAGLTDPTMYN